MKLAPLALAVALVASTAFAQTARPYEWHNVAIVGGGFVSGVQAHPKAAGLFYAKTDIGGAYRRDTSTGPWIPITDSIDQAHWTYTGIESLALDPSDARYVYLAAGSYTNAWSGPGAILRSADRGKTWQTSPVPFKMGGNENGRGCGERLAVDPSLGSTLFFGSRNDGLWRSDDRGATWARVDSFPALGASAKGQGITFVHFDAIDAKPGAATSTIVVGTADPKSPLIRSTDGGKTWASVPHQPTDLFPRHCVEDATGVCFVTYGNGPGPNDVTNGAVYRWTPRNDAFADVSPVKPAGDDKFSYAGIALDAQHPGVLVVSTLDRWAHQDDLFRSINNGDTWRPIRERSVRDWSAAPWLAFDRGTVGIGHWMVDLALDPSNADHLMYVTGWGMWETGDLAGADRNLPTHWTVAARGIEEVVANDVVSPPSGLATTLSVMWDIDGFRHEDVDVSPASGMFKPSYGGNFGIDFAEADPTRVVRVYGGQSVGGSAGDGNGGSISTDNGKTWTPFATKPPIEKSVNGTVAMSADGARVVWTPEDQATVATNDAGKTWTKSAGLPPKLRVVSDRKDANAFYAFDGDGGTLYASADGGAHFAPRATGLPKGEAWLRAAPAAAADVWLTTTRGTFESTDAGATFKKLADIAGHRIGFGKPASGQTYPTVFIAGTLGGAYGFYRSDDRGATWTRINDDDHQFGEITAITGDPRRAGRVYVASRNRGVLYGDPR